MNSDPPQAVSWWEANCLSTVSNPGSQPAVTDLQARLPSLPTIRALNNNSCNNLPRMASSWLTTYSFPNFHSTSTLVPIRESQLCILTNHRGATLLVGPPLASSLQSGGLPCFLSEALPLPDLLSWVSARGKGCGYSLATASSEQIAHFSHVVGFISTKKTERSKVYLRSLMKRPQRTSWIGWEALSLCL